MEIAHKKAHADACQAPSVLQVHRHRQQASPVDSTYTTQTSWLACNGEAGPLLCTGKTARALQGSQLICFCLPPCAAAYKREGARGRQAS